MDANLRNVARAQDDRRQRWFATGGIVGAILASTCCIVPLVLVVLGSGGAWVGTLTSLEPYQPYFLALAAVFLGLGFWHVYFRKTPACEDDSYCARPSSSIVTKTVLWSATVLIILTATMGWWAPLFY